MATATNVATSGAFKGLKTPRELLKYNLMRGVTDFSNLEQYDLYEKGYPFLCVLSIPQFLSDLRDKDPNGVGVIIDNYVHILENDFRGLDGLENITGEASGEITNGIRSISIINKVTKPSNSNFTMNYYERSGSVLTKAHELYLTGIKDPDTGVKHYHGLIDDWVFNGVDSVSGKDPGPHQECFAFMYFITDNTMTKIERAFLIASAQPTTAPYSELYNGNKGDIQFVEIGLSFNGFVINNDYVYQKAQDMLLAMRNPKNLTGSRIIVDSNNFRYKSIAGAGLHKDNDIFSTPGYWDSTNGRSVGADSIATGNVNDSSNAYSGNGKGTIFTADSTEPNSIDGVTYYNAIHSMKGSDNLTSAGGAEHLTNYLNSNSGS